ncbi:MAG: hypothetical protein RMK29_08635 [Myxococcales bacterium]|nr:hypothetical protein [Myxococcota bacterium]MDW8281762.1 hypothetical protein [Myxococcales bacterium]
MRIPLSRPGAASLLLLATWLPQGAGAEPPKPATSAEKRPIAPSAPRPAQPAAPEQRTAAPEQTGSAAPDGGTPPVQLTPPALPPPPTPPPAAPQRPSVPLAPTREDLDRLRTAQKKEAEFGAGHGTVRVLRRPFPTSTGHTAGPGASQGAGTAQDRKAATLEAGGPVHGVRR